VTALAWMDRAVCARLKGWHQAEPEDQAETCRHCPVQAECVAYGLGVETLAVGNEKGFPIYGGLDRAQRLRVRRKRDRDRLKARLGGQS